MNFLVQLLIAVVVAVIAVLLAPKPKLNTDGMAKELENPTASAGKPVPVVFGTLTLKSPNILWYGEKSIREREVSV